MFQPFSWYTAALSGGTEFLDAVQDDTVHTSGNEVRVPEGRSQLLGAVCIGATNLPNWARLETPSLRPLANQSIFSIIDVDDISAVTYRYQRHFRNPRELRVAESMQFAVNESGGTGTDTYGLVWMGDGAIQPVEGKMFTTRLTASITQSDGEWVAGEMTFTEFLPVTRYQVVGMRVETDDGIAARLIFSNSQIRPGGLVNFSGADPDDYPFRYGRSGVWGEFDINQPPRLEVLGGGGASSQVIFLDLIRSG